MQADWAGTENAPLPMPVFSPYIAIGGPDALFDAQICTLGLLDPLLVISIRLSPPKTNRTPLPVVAAAEPGVTQYGSPQFRAAATVSGRPARRVPPTR
jgi:hypothetical protein